MQMKLADQEHACAKLYAAIVERALLDVFEMQREENKPEVERRPEVMEQGIDAHEWITCEYAGRDSFHWCCDLAGLGAYAVRRLMESGMKTIRQGFIVGSVDEDVGRPEAFCSVNGGWATPAYYVDDGEVLTFPV